MIELLFFVLIFCPAQVIALKIVGVAWANILNVLCCLFCKINLEHFSYFRRRCSVIKLDKEREREQMNDNIDERIREIGNGIATKP